jgi:hypothetical protein
MKKEKPKFVPEGAVNPLEQKNVISYMPKMMKYNPMAMPNPNQWWGYMPRPEEYTADVLDDEELERLFSETMANWGSGKERAMMNVLAKKPEWMGSVGRKY